MKKDNKISLVNTECLCLQCRCNNNNSVIYRVLCVNHSSFKYIDVSVVVHLLVKSLAMFVVVASCGDAILEQYFCVCGNSDEST